MSVVLCVGGLWWTVLALRRQGDLTHTDTAGVLSYLPGLVGAVFGGWGFAAAMWALRAQRAAEAAAVDLDRVAKQLAVAVKVQWEDEEAVRRVNDPGPLPVAWRAADANLAESWATLVDLARAWPGGPPGNPALWPADAAGLAGRDGQIGEVFDDLVPTRRLVILGEPGAGKSVLLIRLLRHIIETRTPSDPVPVLFSLSSWNPQELTLKTWLADQLRRAHPALRGTATRRDGSDDLAQALLDAGRILPLLDGLDELSQVWHATAIHALNRDLPAKQPLVVACRAAPYRDALTHPGGMVRLNGAAAIELLPLERDVAADYLRRDAGGPHSPAAERWDAVIALLGTDSPVGQALSTPLGLFLARTVYNPRPQPSTVTAPSAPHPDALCNVAFADCAAVNTHLFQAFIPAAYTPHQSHPPRWSVQQARHTFVFLARFLHTQHAGSPDLFRWALAGAIPQYIHRFVFGSAFGIAFGIVGGFALGPTFGNAFGLAAALACWAGMWVGDEFGEELARMMLGDSYLTPGDAIALVPGFGIVGGFLFGIVSGIAGGLSLGIASGVAYVLAYGLAYFGLDSLEVTARVRFAVARTYLAVRRGTPWNLMAFLQDAHAKRGVLRQVGEVYQFRHIELQRHLVQQQI
ncbi:NACHT domain-containing protein [Streptomyces luteogriseus]